MRKIILLLNPIICIWPKLAEAEINSIKVITNRLPYLSIEHLGSTAVLGLSSKPIIDIFIILKSIKKADEWIKPLETLGYVYWDDNPDKSHRRFFKGMPPFGIKRTHHIHILEAANTALEHRILFRDILRRDEKIRLDYESLKLNLSQLHSADREKYTDEKSEFIKKILLAHGYTNDLGTFF